MKLPAQTFPINNSQEQPLPVEFLRASSSSSLFSETPSELSCSKHRAAEGERGWAVRSSSSQVQPDFHIQDTWGVFSKPLAQDLPW